MTAIERAAIVFATHLVYLVVSVSLIKGRSTPALRWTLLIFLVLPSVVFVVGHIAGLAWETNGAIAIISAIALTSALMGWAMSALWLNTSRLAFVLLAPVVYAIVILVAVTIGVNIGVMRP